MLKGVDVSHYEAEFDFGQGVKDGLSFMFTKATEGNSYVDPSLHPLCAAAQAAGIKYRGAYHFFHDNDPVSVQVQNFLKVWGPLNLELPPVLDLEETSMSQGSSAALTRSKALEWLQQIQQLTKRTPLLYIDVNMYDVLSIGNSAAFNPFPLWMAKYSSHAPIQKWTFWQYTDRGEQAADTDWFNGDEPALRALCGLT